MTTYIPKQMKTLYVSDMDGTLLSSDSMVSRRSGEIISRLTTQGALITVATARTPATVEPLLRGILTSPPAIVMTGAAMWDRREQTYRNTYFLPEDEYQTISELCLRYGVAPFVYVLSPDMHLDVYHAAPKMNRPEACFVQERSGLHLKTFHLATPAPEIARSRTLLLFAMGSRREVEAVAAHLRENSDCYVSCYPDIFNPETGYLEIFAPGVSKADAVLRLKASTGADRVVAFGDNLNDLPMFGVADLAVAVGNALPDVKDAADVVIDPNYTDSVARFIESDFYN